MHLLKSVNKKNKTLTFELRHLKKRSYNDLMDNVKTIWDITEEDLTYSFRNAAIISSSGGYTTLFTDGEKTTILQFNTK